MGKNLRDLRTRFPGCLCFCCHGSLKLYREPSIFSEINISVDTDGFQSLTEKGHSPLIYTFLVWLNSSIRWNRTKDENDGRSKCIMQSLSLHFGHHTKYQSDDGPGPQHYQLKSFIFWKTYISTLSTLIPQDPVASSRTTCHKNL